MYKYWFSEEAFKECEEVAKQRYAANRGANNPTIKMHSSDVPHHADLVGALAEYAVADYFGVCWEGRLFTQRAFSRIKRSINDVQGLEVRASKWPNPHLVLHDEDLEFNPNTPYILVSVPGSYCANIIGFTTPEQGCKEQYWDNKKGHYKAAYFVPSTDLLPIELLKKP